MNTLTRVQKSLADSIQTKILVADSLAELIATAGEWLVQCLLQDHKILTCGNGGSAGDAAHFSSEMLNRFEQERPSLPAIALTTDMMTITAIANDYSYEQIFAKQIRALGHKEDILMVFTTSGNSENILRAVEAGHDRDMRIIALTGKDGGKLKEILHDQDLEIRVPSNVTARIQESHLTIIHCLCDLIDYRLFHPGA